MAEHRVPVLSGSLRRYVDPSLSSDPRIREVVSALSTMQLASAPRAHFRAELRSQLVAVAPRLVAEGPAELVRHTPDTVAAAEQAGPSRLRELASRIPQLRLGRSVRIAVAALTVVALAMSGVVWLSRSALPGDALYGVKRASEDAQLSLTTGNVARGKELLAFAKTRADEVSELLSHTSASGAGPQADGGLNAHTASLARSTLASADDDIRQASQLLGAQAVTDKSSSPLSTMITWAPGQMTRLGNVLARLPSGSLHNRAMSSAKLVSSAFSRAQALQAELGCNCLDNTRTDSLGPVPCQVCTRATPSAPGTRSTSPGSSAPGSKHPKGTHSKTSTTAPTTHENGSSTTRAPTGTPAPGPTGGPTSPGNPLPTLQLPTLQLPSLPLPTVPPLTVDSCGAGVNLGPLNLQLGTCGVHVHI